MKNVPQEILDRKGPRSFKYLNPEVMAYLDRGQIETKNLMEWLAVDQLGLLRHVLEELDTVQWCSDFEAAVNAEKKPSANTTAKIIGVTFGLLSRDPQVYAQLSAHASDVVRCWACWGQSMHHDGLDALLAAMKPYAADRHFGVREVVIFATKERMIANLDKAITILTPWTEDPDDNIRRFAAEALRPVGVWVKKIQSFQEEPELGLPVLEPLMSDPSKYVRDSVGNWLNDASKSQPEWVEDVCDRWKAKSASKETRYIINKALRTIRKK